MGKVARDPDMTAGRPLSVLKGSDQSAEPAEQISANDSAAYEWPNATDSVIAVDRRDTDDRPPMMKRISDANRYDRRRICGPCFWGLLR